MKAARIHEYGQPLVLEEVPIPDIQSDEVLVNVKACGMCRSDVLLVDSFFQNYGDIKPPVTPGYEITGVIDKIGATVSKAAGLVEGDHVVVAAGWGDGKCRHARNPDKLAVAEGCGADHVINIKDKSSSEIAQELSKATGQSALDAVADCAGATEMMQLAFSLLAIGGHYVDVGFVGDRIDIPLFPRVSREQTFMARSGAITPT